MTQSIQIRKGWVFRTSMSGGGASAGACPTPWKLPQIFFRYNYVGPSYYFFLLLRAYSPSVGLFATFFILMWVLFSMGAFFVRMGRAFFGLAPTPPTKISVGALLSMLFKVSSRVFRVIMSDVHASKYTPGRYPHTNNY